MSILLSFDHVKWKGGGNLEQEYKERIEKAIAMCEHYIKQWDNNREIDDIDISHLIEVLKGRE